MRVVLVCDWFLKYTSTLAAAQARAGAEVVLVCRDHLIEFDGDEHERERTLVEPRAEGVRVLEMPGRYWDIQAVPALTRIRHTLHRFDPHVVHIQSPGADPRALGLLPRVPTVLTVHDPVLHPGQPLARFAPKRAFLHGSVLAWQRRAAVVVIHSEHLRPEVCLRDGQRCVVIPHGLVALPRPLPTPSESTVGFFGRLEPYKGLDIIALAMPLVWASRPDVRLRVAGAGDAEVSLSDPRVELQRGYLPEAEITEFFAGISLALLPYTQASQSGAGSQAVGHGVPVIVSHVGGLPDLALDASYVVAPGSPTALATAILAHLDDGDAVRERVLTEIAAPRTWDAAATLDLTLYREIATRSTAAGGRPR